MVNPYQTSRSTSDLAPVFASRTARTYLDAISIGLLTALIAPCYFAVARNLTSLGSIDDSFLRLIVDYIPPALPCILVACVVASLMPRSLSLLLCRWQWILPLCVNTLLFSAFFTAIGLGYLRGTIMQLPLRLSYATCVAGMIVGTAVFLHLVVRPGDPSQARASV